MIAKRWVCLGLLAAAAGCRSASRPPHERSQTPLPASSSSPGPIAEGESVEAAVIVPADNEEEGIAFENDWIWRHYGRFRRRSGGLASLAGRRYDVVTVELSDHTTRTLYFDITDFFGHEKPKPQ
jgi:hypothetical protein